MAEHEFSNASYSEARKIRRESGVDTVKDVNDEIRAESGVDTVKNITNDIQRNAGLKTAIST